MQYHALSIARHGGKVNFIGYVDTEVHPDVKANRLIRVIPIRSFPKSLTFQNRLLFLLLAPFKIIWQVSSLYYALGYEVEANKWMLVQNPPSIPTLAVARIICFFRRTRLIIDWHNFGYSILALRLGSDHMAVRLARRYERLFSQGVPHHLAVTAAMSRVLKQTWQITALTVHDRPPMYFQPIPAERRFTFLKTLPETAPYASDIERKSRRLIVSSTSWTPDEDFSILLDALVAYSEATRDDQKLPQLLTVITGKGPQQKFYVDRIQRLQSQGKLENVMIMTAWLTANNYALLLASADLGVSLHTSSSGVDLPMKVVDMFGAGLPVVGWSKFEAWSELVQEDKNGCGFGSAERLTELLRELFSRSDSKLETLKQGALKESSRRWHDEWLPTVGKVLQLKS